MKCPQSPKNNLASVILQIIIEHAQLSSINVTNIGEECRFVTALLIITIVFYNTYITYYY